MPKRRPTLRSHEDKRVWLAPSLVRKDGPSLTLILDRATAEQRRSRLSPELALLLFEGLYEQAHTEPAAQTVAGLLELLRFETE